MPDIIITEPMDQDAADGLTRRYDVLFDPSLADRPDDIIAAVAGSRALIVRNRTQVRGDLLDAATALQVVGRLGVGLDNIDVDACRERGIPVYPATGANTDSVAELVIGALFALYRGAYHASGEVLAGRWPRLELKGLEVQNRTLGLVGFGAIARAVAKRAVPLGMTVQAFDPNIADDDPAWEALDVRPADLATVLRESDAVSLHVPLIEATRHMIDEAAIASMRDGARLINAARGGIVDELALAEALKAGKLGGAFLDVFEAEPVAQGSHLEGVPNLILAPHIGAMTEEADRRVSFMIADKVTHVLEGEEVDGQA